MAIDLKAITPNKVSDDFASYSTFIYGVPKVGKSTFVTDLYGDRILQIFTEKRFKALEGAYVQYVSSWNEYMQVMKQLRDPEIKSMFDAVSIDTVENLFAMLEKFIAAKFNEAQVGEGSVAYGKDWTALAQTWVDGISMIEKNGYVPVFVAHAKEVTTQIPKSAIIPSEASGIQMEEVKSDGIEYMEFKKYVPDGKDRMIAPVRNMSDNILFMHMTTDENGKEHRVISTRETLQWEAGSTFKDMKPNIPLSADAYKQAVKEALGKIDDSVKTTERKASADIHGETLDYDELMNQMKELGKWYVDNERGDELREATEDVFGIGVRATEAKPNQVEVVKTLVDKLLEMK